MITVRSAANHSFAGPNPAVVRRATGGQRARAGAGASRSVQVVDRAFPLKFPAWSCQAKPTTATLLPPGQTPDTGETAGETDSVTGSAHGASWLGQGRDPR